MLAGVKKPVQFKILIVIIRKYKRYITTYYSRLIYRLLPIVSLVYSGVSHITVGETITESSLLFIETQYLSCLRSFSVKPLDLFTNRCSKMALIRDEKDKYLCSEIETISLLGLELSLFLKSLVTLYQIYIH